MKIFLTTLLFVLIVIIGGTFPFFISDPWRIPCCFAFGYVSGYYTYPLIWNNNAS